MDDYQNDPYDDSGELDLPDPYSVPEVEVLLEEAIETLVEARPMPMSTTVKVQRDELLALLEEALDRLPSEVRAARWLLKEREDYIAKARQEHQDLITEGRAQVEMMVSREQVVKQAEAEARQLLTNARREANTMKRQVEEYCDRRLAKLEAVLVRTTEQVQRGRRKLVGLSDDADYSRGEHGDEVRELRPRSRRQDQERVHDDDHESDVDLREEHYEHD